MRLIIDIPEELYKKVVEHSKTGYIGSDVWIAVANGTPYEERPQGEWVDCGAYYKCPFCENFVLPVDGKLKFCDECGAEMKIPKMDDMSGELPYEQ